MLRPDPSNPNATSGLIAVVMMAAIMPITLLVAPLLVGQLISQFHLSASQSGWLLSIELAGMCAATVIALVLMKRMSWRRLVGASLAVAVVGNVLSAYAHDFVVLALLRAFVGLGSGTIMSLTLAAVGQTDAKERNFGFWLLAELVSGVIGLFVLPMVFAHFGLAGYFIGVAIFQCAIVPLVWLFPDAKPDETAAANKTAGVSLEALASLAALLFVFISIAGVWTYAERIGHASGLEPQFIGSVLAFGAVFGIVGAVCATAVGAVFKRSLWLVVGFVILLLGMVLLMGHQGVMRFVLAAALFKFAWTFNIPFMLASVSARDPSGRFIVISNFVMAGGVAAGPAIGAVILQQGFSYDVLLVSMIAVGLASAALILFPELRSLQLPKSPQAAPADAA